MKVTYIHHSSFLVETESCYLLFDYYKGKIPELSPGKSLYVLASHSHYDHFDKSIFKLARKHPDVTYILSDDISKSSVPMAQRHQTVFVGPYHTWSDNKIKVETLKSTDLGVAFWVTVNAQGGRVQGTAGSAAKDPAATSAATPINIYFAGDLNDWNWDGDAGDIALEQDYLKELQRIQGRTADAAFVPVDPRLGKRFALGLAYFIKYVDAKTIFPMHFWKKYDVIDRVKHNPSTSAVADRIADISYEGEEYTL